MSTAVARTDEDRPVGSRQLGIRVKPIIRLGMGIKKTGTKNGETYTYPAKTDYFTVRGDERAVAKFKDVRGEQPKAVQLMLPAAIEQALTIQYRAFKGGQNEDGGSLVAVGHTNFALRDYCGGPDVLTVWAQDGTVSQVETLGLDAITREPLDEIAKDLGLELYTTLRAGMPDVLGFGSFFDLSTKGKESTDNLWSKLREIYAIFGSRTPIAVKPMLVIRPSTARPVVIKDGQAKRIKTTIYVADVVIPETIDEALERLRERNELLAPQGPVAALYGPGTTAPLAELPAPPEDVEPEEDWEQVDDADVEVVDEETDGAHQASVGDQQAGAEHVAAPTNPQGDDVSAPVPGDEDEPAVGSPFVAPASAQLGLEEAGAAVITRTEQKGRTLAELAELEKADEWLQWAIRRAESYWGSDFRIALEAFVAARFPEMWTAFVEERDNR